MFSGIENQQCIEVPSQLTAESAAAGTPVLLLVVDFAYFWAIEESGRDHASLLNPTRNDLFRSMPRRIFDEHYDS